MRRHLRWIIPLLIAPVRLFGGLALASLPSTSTSTGGPNLLRALGSLALLAVSFIGFVIALSIAIAGAVKISAVYPEVGNWTLVAQFENSEPLMLRGVMTPATAVITTMMTHGLPALESHPGLQNL